LIDRGNCQTTIFTAETQRRREKQTTTPESAEEAEGAEL